MNMHVTCKNGIQIYARDDQKANVLKRFIDSISDKCPELFFQPNASLPRDEIDVDICITYHQIAVCVVLYAQNSDRIEWCKYDLPLILRSSQISIGIVVDSKENLYMFGCGDTVCKQITTEQIVEKLNDECLQIPTDLNVSETKEVLMNAFDDSADFPNKSKSREIFEKACNNLSCKNGAALISIEEENNFFRAILGDKEIQYVCRYMTLSSLFQIVKNKKVALNGIASMNDSTEGVYADCKMPWYVQRERGEVEIDRDNNVFLLCCCDDTLYDNLTMWRLYGDDSKGVCIRFSVDASKIDNNRFFFAPVNYAKSDGTHPELGLISNLYATTIAKGWHFHFQQWFFWKYCFKPYEYSTEKEIRLVFFPFDDDNELQRNWYMDSSNGIFNRQVLVPINSTEPLSMPLTIEEVLLGPKSSNADKNVEQVWLMGEYLFDSVKKSKIQNYR